MISRKDLEERYSGFSNEELLEVLRNREGYTELAVDLAREELSRRNVTAADVKVMEEAHQQNVNHFIENYASVEMRFLQKCFFFFLWMPLLHFAIKQNLREDGYLLMVKQAGYYSVMGFIFFFLMPVSLVVLPDALIWVVWVLGLFIAIPLEKYFVKRDF